MRKKAKVCICAYLQFFLQYERNMGIVSQLIVKFFLKNHVFFNNSPID